MSPWRALQTLLLSGWLCLCIFVNAAEATGTSESATIRLQSLASAGDSDAQLELSKRYYRGTGLQQSNERALYWLKRAVAEGNRKAEFLFAKCYGAGVLVPGDRMASLFWLTAAAQKGWPTAEAELGLDMLAGLLVTKRDPRGLYWLIKAANEGNKEAQRDLPSFYAYGIHIDIPVPQDYVEALFWAEIAVRTGATSQQDMQEIENEAKAHLDPTSLANVQERVLAWSPTPF